MTESVKEQEQSSINCKFTKAEKLLAFLRDSRTDDDYDRIVQIFQRTSNSKAVQIFEEEKNITPGSQITGDYWNSSDPIILPPFPFSYQHQGVVAGYTERVKLQLVAIQHLTSEPAKDTPVTFPVVVLHGFGGNGKSQIARKIGQILRKTYNINRIWINAACAESVLEGFRKLAHVVKDVLDKDISDFMKEIYRKLNGRKVLLVLDDGDDFSMLKKFLPLNENQSNIMLIVTAHTEWLCNDPNVKNMLVSNFTPIEFREFLKATIKRYNINGGDFKLLAGHTGRIPAIVSLVCKGFELMSDIDTSYTIVNHLEDFGDKIFRFSEDVDFIPGLEEYQENYGRCAKVSVKQQLLFMTKVKYYASELVELAKFTLNYLAYCDPNSVSQANFFSKHPHILSKAEGDTKKIIRAIGILKKFGWIELVSGVETRADKKMSDGDEILDNKVYSIHACYQAGLRSEHVKKEVQILQGMIEYLQYKEEDEMLWAEKCRHQRSFWCNVVRYNSLLTNYAIKTNHCLIGLIKNGMVEDVKYLTGAYKDKGDLVQALLYDEVDADFTSSPMFYLCLHVDHEPQAIRYFVSEIKQYYDQLIEFEKKVWVLGQQLAFNVLQLTRLFFPLGSQGTSQSTHYAQLMEIKARIRHQLLYATTGAIISNEYETLKLILDTFDLNVNEGLGQECQTILHWTVFTGKLEMVQLVVEGGAEINVKNRYGFTPFQISLFHDPSLQIATFLLQKGANIDDKDVDGFTSLHWAISKKNIGIVNFLIAEGANVNEKNNYGKPAIHLGVNTKHLEIVKLLIAKITNIDEKDEYGFTALHIAICKGNLEIVKVLIEKGASMEERTGMGATSIQLAASRDILEIVNLLIHKGSDIGEKDENGCTALHIAVDKGNLEIVKVLIENGASINDHNKHGVTALHLASTKKLQTVSILVENGANIHEKDIIGNTALHMAAGKGNLEILKLLLQKGANINEKNNSGETAIQLATREEHLAIVNFLAQKGAYIEGKVTGENQCSITVFLGVSVLGIFMSIVWLWWCFC